MIIAEVSIVPLGTGSTSLSEYVAKAVSVLKSFKNIRVEVHSMGTVLEADDLDTIFAAVKKAHNEVFNMGVNRVLTQIKIDDRRDKPATIKSKIEAVMKNIG
ncbi:MAG: MTH1187 family thiamine-binding protein [Candidatus Odinarchaeum yellowstonii]|uniref:MTH1187 family thiamine-binding protein n=1 Tax=Odinarchaeota yellowstonii (strain LCB_4) TaxID=1841599 RepID=A0AAF0D217_ODILC|nr:MAG: MTH1187 family thiamine-binding protein [Candidatus Odinarchaeum yellowstonii]